MLPSDINPLMMSQLCRYFRLWSLGFAPRFRKNRNFAKSLLLKGRYGRSMQENLLLKVKMLLLPWNIAGTPLRKYSYTPHSSLFLPYLRFLAFLSPKTSLSFSFRHSFPSLAPLSLRHLSSFSRRSLFYRKRNRLCAGWVPLSFRPVREGSRKRKKETFLSSRFGLSLRYLISAKGRNRVSDR